VAAIYLSSSFCDLQTERAAVAAALCASGHQVVAMESYPTSAECPTDRCTTDAREADLYVGLFARRYGYVPPAASIAITEIEYRSAMAANRPSAIFLLDEAAEWPARWTDACTGEGESGRRIADLRRELCERHDVSFFTTSAGLTAAAALTATGI
jgi:hypothetical protein